MGVGTLVEGGGVKRRAWFFLGGDDDGLGLGIRMVLYTGFCVARVCKLEFGSRELFCSENGA